MSQSIENLTTALTHGMSIRPPRRRIPLPRRSLAPSGRHQKPLDTPLLSEPLPHQVRLIRALRTDQAGQSTFPEFLKSSWAAGVVSYDVDFLKRQVTYYGALGESYVEEYPAVDIESKS